MNWCNMFLKRPLHSKTWEGNIRMNLRRTDAARTRWRWCALANSVVALLPEYWAFPSWKMITWIR